MKRKFLSILLFVFVIAFVFAISICAEKFTLTYYDEGTEKETATTNENGEITLKDTCYSADTGNKTFFGWFTYEGDMYKPGETVTLTKDTNVYQFFGFKGTQKNFQTTQSQWSSTYIQLQEDVVFENAISWDDGGKLFVDLNGYTITSSASHVFSQRRAGLTIVGEGSIIHTGTGGIFRSEIHGYDDRRVSMYVGKNVKIVTGGVVYDWVNGINSGWIDFPVPFEIYGDVTCKQLMYVNGTTAEVLNIIVKPKRLEITGESLFSLKTYPEQNLINVIFGGSTFQLNDYANNTAFWNNDNPQSYNISVVGGNYRNGGSVIENYLMPEYTTVVNEVDGVNYTAVVLKSACNHEYEVTNETNATCISYASKTYTCKHCQDAYVVLYGDIADHDWKLINEIQPTGTTAGIKEYECNVCKKLKTEKVFLNIVDSTVIVTVSVEGIEKEVEVVVSDVFDLETVTENKYKLKGLKAFGEYEASDIVAINVLLGIVKIDFASDNSTLKKMVICDGASLEIVNFSKCKALTHIEIGSAEVVFKNGCSNNVIESIKSCTEGANVIFESKVFNDKSSLKEIKLSTKSTYIFGGNSFRHTSIKEFIAPDYSDITFGNEAAFYQCNSLEYIYIGRGIEVLAGKPFDYCQKVQKIVLMEVKSIIMEYTFCVEDSGEKPVEVYIHSDSISLPNNTFHKCHGVTIYTNAPITNANVFSECQPVSKGGVDYPKYTIYYGIPHKFVEAYEEPTCLEYGVNGYKTDCPCGVQLDGTVYAKLFYDSTTNSENYEEIEYISTAIEPLGHKEGEVLFVEYLNGYLETGLKKCICSVCEENYIETVPTADPLFVFLGYSVPEDGRNEITIGFIINYVAINQYEVLNETTVEYGLVLAIADNLNGKSPLDSENVPNVKNITLSRDLCRISFKVSGFTEDLLDLELVMAIYVKENDSTVYLQDTQSDMPSTISVNQIRNG